MTILAGLVGIALGAWLSALLTTSRERWNLKRELYTRLLENLGEAEAYLFALSKQTPRNDLDPLDPLLKAIERVRRARSVAAIFLSEEACRALDRLKSDWLGLPAESKIEEGMKAVAVAYRLVVAAARRDLRIRQRH